jgi:hypothetical protein
MYPNMHSENKVIAALLTVALAKSKPSSSSAEILADYNKFLSELSPKIAATMYETDKPRRKPRPE